MTYFPDLSPYTYSPRTNPYNIPTLNVGWLGMPDYSRGTVPALFVDRLGAFCATYLFMMRGFHICEFCPHSPVELLTARPVEVKWHDKTLSLGYAEIRVLGQNGKIYAAPNLIYHYVTEHNYRPPEEFVQAVLDAPLPGTSEYERLKEEMGWK